jgi:ABC-type nitrate/sulfonate/bicarbonate transport system substrate-binding protein
VKAKVGVWLLLLTLGLVLATGCSPTRPPAKEPAAGEAGPPAVPVNVLEPLSPAVAVTVGAKEVVSDAGLLIGMAQGYYEELGLKVESVNFNTGQEMINALAAGQLDVGCTVSASGLFNAMLRDIPIQVVADKGVNIAGQGYYRLCIGKDLVDEIKDFEDLRGRRLAIVGTASLDEIALDRCLNAGGMSTANKEDVQLEIIRAFPDIVAAIANGSIDGGMVIEPFVAQGMSQGILDPWKDPAEYDPHAQTAFLIYGTSIINQPEIADRFMIAYIKALRDYNDAFVKGINKAEIITMLAETSVVKEEALYEQMFPVGLNPDGYVREKGVELDLEWYQDRGLLKGELTLADVLDNQYVDRALQVLGKYE